MSKSTGGTQLVSSDGDDGLESEIKTGQIHFRKVTEGTRLTIAAEETFAKKCPRSIGDLSRAD